MVFRLSDAQPERLRRCFPEFHGKPRVDDRRMLIGIILIKINIIFWRGAPKEDGPHNTLYNRWKRWTDKGIFDHMAGLAAEHGETQTVMIDANYLKAHRTASIQSGREKGGAAA